MPATSSPSACAAGARPPLGRVAGALARARASRALPLALESAACLALFALLRPRLLGWTRLPEAGYFEPWIAWQALRQPGALLLLLPGVLALLRRRELAWRRLDCGGALRLIAGGAALALAWSLATLDYNLYLDRWHALDRALLAASALLVLAHPGFAAPFLVSALAFAGQLEHPLGAQSWTDKAPLVHLLLLFSVWLAFACARRADARVFLLLALCARAADYVVPAFGKLEIGWLEHERLAHLWLAARSHGWLAGLPEETALRVAAWIDAANAPLLWATLALELAPLLAFADRRLAAALLLGAIGLHAGIFAASGICFWKWMWLDALLAGAILGPARARIASLFGPRSPAFWLSVPLVGCGAAVFGSVRLAWIDTPLDHVYAVEVVGASGRAYPVGPEHFAPYDLHFAQNRFAYLVDAPHLAMTYGGSHDLAAARSLSAARGADEVRAIDARLGASHRDRERVRRLAHFLARHFAALNRQGEKPRLALRAPHHIWASAGEGAWVGQEPVERVRVRWRTTWFDGRARERLRDALVLEVALQAAAPRAAGS
jgi:hypothetical protein